MRLLFVEDNLRDVELTVAELRRFGFELECERVDTLEALGSALERSSWSVIVCDYDLPGLTGHDVLQFVRERDREIPFIVLSGTMDEDLRAVDLMRAGANDYVYKDRLTRLGPAIERELRDVQLREERRSLFNALRRSEDRYRRIFENAPVGVAVSTPDGTLLAVNERFTAIVGQPAQQIVGRPMSDFTTGVHTAPGNPHRSERRFVRSDGELVWTTVSIAPITSESFEVEQLVWLVEDVTTQKQREAELRIHRAQLEEAQRMAQMGSYELDLATGRRLWSAGLFRIFGYDTSLQPDLALLDARIHPDDREQVRRTRRVILASFEPYIDEYRVVLPGGEIRTVQDRGSFLHGEDGRPSKIVGIVQDVTDTRVREDERQRVTRSLQLLLESTVEGIITADLAGCCTMSNRSAAEMLGRTQDDMPGATLQTLLNGGEHAAISPIVDVARSGEVRLMTSGTFYRADGTPFPVEYSAAPIIDAGVRIGVVISFSDITERRKLETKLEQADRLSSLGRLAATIAHEFNNVLMGISPFVEVVRRGRNVESSLDHIGRAVKRGKRITQDILRFTQPAQPVRTAIEVGPWMETVTLEARSLMPRGCVIQSRTDSGLRIDGDPSQLQQIFTNLILNARDAMPDGGTFSIEVRREPPHAKLPFAVDRPERFAHVIVRDTGTGMSDETQRHIFEPLFTTKQNGTGLGLPVTHQVVQRHGGDIFVESTLGMGTTFHIFLPLAEEGARVAEPAIELAAFAGAHRVLLVEDDSTVALGLVSLLELEGLHVDVAHTGEEALRRVESIGPDVVILDVGLPDMDGTQVFALLSQRYPDLPIVFSTGHADRARLDAYLERPHVSCLLKPYESSSLLTAIRDVMA